MYRTFQSYPPYVGTRLVPRRRHRRYLARELAAAWNGTSGGPVTIHNAMTLYTMTMLMFATGHRSVSDPFHVLDIFDRERNIVLIEDKVIGASHLARLAWLPPLAFSQIDHYHNHLRALSRILRRKNGELSDHIWAVTELAYPRPLPLFFFLTSKPITWRRIRPADYKNALGDKWILPLNSDRHMLPTWLSAEKCPAECIAAQLGHIEAGCQPFGITSVLNPEHVGATLVPFLERYLKELNWVEMPGLRAGKGFLKPNLLRKATSLKDDNPPKFGPDARAAKRQSLWRNDVCVVDALFAEEFPKGVPKQIEDSRVEELQERLLRKAGEGDGRFLIRCAHLRRKLIKLRKEGISVKLPGRFAVSRTEPSPFKLGSLTAARSAEAARERFIGYLAGRLKLPLEPERRLAEIVIAAALFGAQTDPRVVDGIPFATIKGIQVIDSCCYIDITLYPEEPNSPIRRWFPDPTSLALMIGFQKIFGINSLIPDTQKISEAAVEILADLGFSNAFRRRPAKISSPSKGLAKLTTSLKPFWRLRLPGVLCAYAEGEHPCASVPSSNMFRLVTGRRLVGALANRREALSSSTDDLIAISRYLPKTANLSQALVFWRMATKILGPDAESSGKSKKGANLRPIHQKRHLEANLLDLLSRVSKDIPTVANLFTSWLIHLCRHGTVHTPNLRASSVVAYAYTIGRSLCEQGYDLDVLALSDLAFEEFYRRILDLRTRQNKDYVAARLEEFHGFLVQAYSVPDVDWSELRDGDSINGVDAGLISLDEYLQALNILFNESGYDERTKLIHAAILFFAYRFGLRRSEIFRLTSYDVLRDGSDVIVYIRNSWGGDTKTDNGVRQIPLIENLTQEEWQLLDRWLSHVEVYVGDNELASLFSLRGSERDRIDYGRAVTHVVETLRTVTGDTSVRLRHLRHSYATRLHLAMSYPQRPEGLMGRIYMRLWGDLKPETVRHKLLGRPEVSLRGLYAAAVALGHGGPGVMLHHYVHLADLTLYDHSLGHRIKPDDKALAYAYQTSYANIRQIRSRKDSDEDPELLTHFSRGLPKLDIDSTDGPVDMFVRSLLPPAVPIDVQIGLADVDRILAVAGVRDSFDGIAERFLVPEAWVRRLLISAAKLQQDTGFTDFGLPVFAVDDKWLPQAAKRGATLDKESQRARRFLGNLAYLLRDDELLSACTRIWRNAYVPSSQPLLIPNRRDFECFLDGMYAMDIPLEALHALLPAPRNDMEVQRWKDVEAELVQKGLTVKRQPRLPLRPDRSHSQSRIGLVMRPDDSHVLGYQHTLNRALFVLTCWQDAKAFLVQDAGLNRLNS